METQNKKNNKLIWIIVGAVLGLAVIGWCVYNAISTGKITTIFNMKSSVLLTLIFLICGLGYLLGGITIKGVNLGTAGVFLVAILFGFLCTLNFGEVPILGAFHVDMSNAKLDEAGRIALMATDRSAYELLIRSETLVETFGDTIQNFGLLLFVGSVGLIAGPNFFKNLVKNFKTYIVLGVVIIVSGTLVALLFNAITDYGSGFWAGILSGALTTTPGFSAAQEAGKDLTTEAYNRISLGHAIAYPFGVIGVVLFVQLLPKFLKADMDKERGLIKIDGANAEKNFDGLYEVEPFGLVPLAITMVLGLILGSVKIPLFDGSAFSLGKTGGVLIMGLIMGHFGKIGKFSLQVPESTLKLMREFGLMLFLLGAGFEGGVNLVSSIGDDASIVIWGFIGGALMSLVPMVVGFILAKLVMKMPLLNTLGSITGGMTSTPALGTLISTAKTEDVASAYASTYPIALVLIVLACQLMVTFL